MEIKLAFFKAKYGGFFSKLIKWRTGGDHSHVEMIFPQYKIFDKKQNRELSLCFSSYEKEGGVRFKFIYLNKAKWDFVPVEIPDNSLDELLSYAASLADAKYDWFGIVKFVLPHVPEKPDRFFCSEVIVHVLQKVFWLMPELISYKTSPNALFKYLQTNSQSNLLIQRVGRVRF